MDFPSNRPNSPAPVGLEAGTLVTMPDGAKPIEEIKAGDLVLSGVVDGFSRYYPVKKAMAKQYVGPILSVTTHSVHQFHATPNHICFAYSADMEYVEGSIVVWAFSSFVDKKGIPNKVIRHTIHDRPNEFLETNLDKAEEVALQLSRSRGRAEIKRYFVDFDDDMDDAGYLFMPASDLKVGMHVLTAKEFVVTHNPIANITEEHYEGFVYDLDIPEARNFAANGVLVHDSAQFS